MVGLLTMVDPKWLDALKLPPKVVLSIALGTGALIVLDHLGEFDLAAFGPLARWIVLGLCVVSSISWLVGIADLFLLPLRERQRQSRLAVRRAVRRREKEEQRAEHEARVLARLDYLSRDEISQVSECLCNNTPSFYAYVRSPAVATLMGKGLVWTTGGVHPDHSYPFLFYDFVWEELLRREVEFHEKQNEHVRAEKETKEAQRRRRRH